MDKANLVEYYLDIILGFPHCDYVFELSTHEIPTEGSTYQVCDKCQIPLEIKPISIEIEFKKSIKLKSKKDKKNKGKYNRQNKSVQRAKLAIKSYGFTEEQFNNAFNEVKDLYEPGWEPIKTETLIREILSRIDKKHEPSKT